MIHWSPEHLAAASGARLLRPPGVGGGPRRAVVDSRLVRPGDLFFGLAGARTDGGRHADEAFAAGAWGVLAQAEYLEALADDASPGGRPGGALLAHREPLRALQSLAGAWRDELVRDGARVIAVTGSTGKTSTKDILAALLRGQLRAWASPANLNTGVGLPLAVLEAPHGTEALILEMAMRGPGQIAELAAVARPHVGLIVNIGPVHLELLGSLEAIAGAKAELIESLPSGATAVIPAHEPLLDPHLRSDLRTITFGEGGDLRLVRSSIEGEVLIADDTPSEVRPQRSAAVRTISLRPSFSQAHNLRNLLAAVAAARALDLDPFGRVDVAFSALRGERVALAGGIMLINDCYNANPMSMKAAIEDLAARAPGRRVAVLGDMLELGPQELALHRELAHSANVAGLHLLVTVGPLAAAMREPFLADSAARGSACGGPARPGRSDGGPPEAHSVADAEAAAVLLRSLLRSGDTVLVKGSRGIHLERVAATLLRESAQRGT